MEAKPLAGPACCRPSESLHLVPTVGNLSFALYILCHLPLTLATLCMYPLPRLSTALSSAHLLSAVDPSTGKPLDASQLKAEVSTFMLAGFETTSHGISWTLTLLVRGAQTLFLGHSVTACRRAS